MGLWSYVYVYSYNIFFGLIITTNRTPGAIWVHVLALVSSLPRSPPPLGRGADRLSLPSHLSQGPLFPSPCQTTSSPTSRSTPR